jgi:hypothetical protein
MILSLAREWLLEPDWITSLWICGVVITASLVSMFVIRTFNGKPRTADMPLAVNDEAAHGHNLANGSKWQDKTRLEKKVNLESRGTPAAVASAAATLIPIEKHQTSSGGENNNMNIQKPAAPEHAAETKTEHGTVAPATTPVNTASNETGTQSEPKKETGSVFDIFNDAAFEETEIGKMAAKMNNVDVVDLNKQALSLLSELNKRS